MDIMIVFETIDAGSIPAGDTKSSMIGAFSIWREFNC